MIFGLALLVQCLPDLGCFVAYPSWLKRAEVFTTCEWSLACQRVTGTLKTVLAVFLSTWELAAKAAEGPSCFLDGLLWHNALQMMGFLGHTLLGPKRAQIFIPWKCSAACHRVTRSAKLLWQCFYTWEPAGQAGEGQIGLVFHTSLL